MAITLSWIALFSLMALLILQGILVFRYFGIMTTKRQQALPPGNPAEEPTAQPYSPHTAVVLCLRGDDPSLAACLNSLVAQTYPNFEIHFVIDSPQDPATKTLERFFETNSNCPIKSKQVFLTGNSDSNSIIETCSLKNQSLIAAISNADQAIEVFALVDADGVVEPNWLADLVAPLADRFVGATTGSRWFAPLQRDPGSLVRQTWNAAALPQMSFYNIPWGGALALKRSAIEYCDLLFHWSEGFCEDTMLPKLLDDNDYWLVQVPSVIVESTESTTLPSALNWISRQLLTVRLHHESWPLVLGHAIFSGVCLGGSFLTMAMCVWHLEFFPAARLLLAIITFLIANVGLLQVIERANRRGALALPKSSENESDGEPKKIIDSLGPRFYWALLTQLVYPLIAIKAALMRSVQWRGITYSIGPGKKITMDAYHPYQEWSRTTDSDASL